MRARLFRVLLVSMFAAGCGAGSNSIEVTGPTAVKCQVSVTNAMTGTVPAQGADSTIAIDTTRDCTRTASADAPWIVITPAAAGQGGGTVGYRVAANGEAVQRRGSLDVNNSKVEITQQAAPCRFAVTPASATVPAAGATLTETVETPSGCAWSASSPVNWAVVTANPSGNRSGSVTIAVAVNEGSARSTTVTVAGQAVTIQQIGSSSEPPPPTPCDVSLGSTMVSLPVEGGTGSVGVTAGGACVWTAVSNAPWITITNGASGTGNGAVAFSVAANSGEARSGTLTIGGRAFTVTQAAAQPAPCTFSIAPTSQNVSEAGGTGSTEVTSTTGNCAWTAVSNADWIAVTNGGTGRGNGRVDYSVAPNTGAERSGTITVAGQTLTITQAAAPAPCTFSIAPPGATLPTEGGSGMVTIAASASTCAWTAASPDSWVIIGTPSSGSGSGSITYVVAANPGAARTTTLTIAGQPFTISQAGSSMP
jgi:hypothetical protein